MAASIEFDTTVTATGKNTGIIVPDEQIDRLGAGRRPSVIVNIDSYEYRNTVGVMGGKHMISISAGIRKETGLKGGDPIHVKVTVADTPRTVEVPDDFRKALATKPDTSVFFAKLSNSLQRYHIDNINGAKSPETRQRRIEKAVSLFREGRQRRGGSDCPRCPDVSGPPSITNPLAAAYWASRQRYPQVVCSSPQGSAGMSGEELLDRRVGDRSVDRILPPFDQGRRRHLHR